MKKITQYRSASLTRSLLLLVALLGLSLPALASYDFADTCATGQVIYYNITDYTNRTMSVTYPAKRWDNPYFTYTQPTGALTIPATVICEGNTYSVTNIGGNAFSNCSGLTSVTIPNSVTTIDGSAFGGCSGLTSVAIPNSVTAIGDNAFGGCSGLTNVIIPNSVIIIGNSAFGDCSSITSVTIPNSVTTIGDWAFSGCSGLTSVTIPNSVTSISVGAFAYCNGLTSVTIPNSVTTIGASAFFECSSLTSVTIGNSVTSIDNRAFYGCIAILSATSDAEIAPILGYEIFSGFDPIRRYLFPKIAETVMSPKAGIVTLISESRVPLCEPVLLPTP